MSEFVAKVSGTGNAVLLEMGGSIDENAAFNRIEIGKARDLVVDLEKVTRINSVGIRSWMIWFNANARGKNLTFRSCPSIVVNQFNLVMEFLPSDARVESIFVPYYCENCDHQDAIILKEGSGFRFATADAPAQTHLPVNTPCPRCGETMEPDINLQSYFGFLKRHGGR